MLKKPNGLAWLDFRGVHRSRVVLTGDEDCHDDCQPFGGYGAGHPGLSDCGERHDCGEHQRQRSEPESLATLHDLEPLACLGVPALRWQCRRAHVMESHPRFSVLRRWPGTLPRGWAT
jgi:hypothetical protein